MEPYKTTYKTYFGLIHKITTDTPEGSRTEYELSMGAQLLLIGGAIIGALAVTEASERQNQREIEALDRCLERTLSQPATIQTRDKGLGYFL